MKTKRDLKSQGDYEYFIAFIKIFKDILLNVSLNWRMISETY